MKPRGAEFASRIIENDRKSKPLRDAAMRWLRDRNFGGCQQWTGYMWYIEIYSRPRPLRVEVTEDGSRAFVWEEVSRGSHIPLGKARTARGLLQVLDKARPRPTEDEDENS